MYEAKLIEMKREINNEEIIVGKLKTSFATMDTIDGQVNQKKKTRIALDPEYLNNSPPKK